MLRKYRRKVQFVSLVGGSVVATVILCGGLVPPAVSDPDCNETSIRTGWSEEYPSCRRCGVCRNCEYVRTFNEKRYCFPLLSRENGQSFSRDAYGDKARLKYQVQFREWRNCRAKGRVPNPCYTLVGVRINPDSAEGCESTYDPCTWNFPNYELTGSGCD